jgi:hypothetical protein
MERGGLNLISMNGTFFDVFGFFVWFEDNRGRTMQHTIVLVQHTTAVAYRSAGIIQ